MHDTHDSVHQDQIREGKQRSTLHVNAGSRTQQRGRTPFVAKGHDAILKGIQDAKGRIIVMLMSTIEKIEGTLVARDKFTITVHTDDGRRITIYKHAIEGFEQAQVL